MALAHERPTRSVAAPLGSGDRDRDDAAFGVRPTLATGWWAPDRAQALTRDGQRYQLYGLTQPMGQATGGAARQDSDLCESLSSVELTPRPRPEVTLALSGNWDAMPRTPTLVTNPPPVYREVINALWPAPNLSISQVLRVDLEGDGVEEVLITASYGQGTGTEGGDAAPFSVIVLRRIVGGIVRHFPLGFEEEGAPELRYTVAAIADVDGDGTMEIIVGWALPESDGFGANVFRVTQDGVEPTPLGFGC